MKVLNTERVELKKSRRSYGKFNFKKSVIDSSNFNSEELGFDIKELAPGELSYPYHYHSSVEEIYLIIEGEVTLRKNNKKRVLYKGDLAFMEKSEPGAHQLYNHSDAPVRYLGVSSKNRDDICFYPDSNKINACKDRIFKIEDNVDYFDGEEEIPKFWDED